MKLFTAIVFLLIFVLSGCGGDGEGGGFKPLYAKKNHSIDTVLNNVRFESTSERSGQVLYTALYEKLKTQQNSQPADYVLKTTNLDILRSGIGIAIDGTYQLEQIIITANFSVIEDANKEELESFSLRAVSSYNVAEADAYSSEITFENSRNRMLYDIAEQARLRLVDILNRHDEL